MISMGYKTNYALLMTNYAFLMTNYALLMTNYALLMTNGMTSILFWDYLKRT